MMNGLGPDGRSVSQEERRHGRKSRSKHTSRMVGDAHKAGCGVDEVAFRPQQSACDHWARTGDGGRGVGLGWRVSGVRRDTRSGSQQPCRRLGNGDVV